MKKIVLVVSILPVLGLEMFAFSGKGHGTAGFPYIIKTYAQLKEMADNLSAHYYLANDIDASGSKNENDGYGFAPIGTLESPFTGICNGNGHTISNLVIKSSNENPFYRGLFGYISSATISKVNISNIYMLGYFESGGLVGYSENSTIIYCSSSGKVDGGTYTSGLVGYNKNGTIQYCFSNCEMETNYDNGVLVGCNSNGLVSDCYSKGSISFYATGASLVGRNYGQIKNCYSTVSMSAHSDGEGYSLTASDNENVYNCFYNQNVYRPCYNYISKDYKNPGTMLPSDSMKMRKTFTDAGWDFDGETANGTDDVWRIDSAVNDGYPYLYCESDANPANIDSLPVVKTLATRNIATESASLFGEVLYAGFPEATRYGFVWASSPDPTIGNASKWEQDAPLKPGEYNYDVTGLASNCTYFVRAYAITIFDTTYAGSDTFTTVLKDDVAIKVFPSITTASFQVSFDAIVDDGEVQIFSIDGRVAKRVRFSRTKSIAISVGELSRGKYVVRVKASNSSAVQFVEKL